MKIYTEDDFTDVTDGGREHPAVPKRWLESKNKALLTPTLVSKSRRGRETSAADAKAEADAKVKADTDADAAVKAKAEADAKAGS